VTQAAAVFSATAVSVSFVLKQFQTDGESGSKFFTNIAGFTAEANTTSAPIASTK